MEGAEYALEVGGVMCDENRNLSRQALLDRIEELEAEVAELTEALTATHRNGERDLQKMESAWGELAALKPKLEEQQAEVAEYRAREVWYAAMPDPDCSEMTDGEIKFVEEIPEDD